ncbi:hypothetical protein F5Y14DRAFT_364390 [Nemania sp. NC0429]|nr:hypothetical protein F5Y14DRAFT_364390 [Nemania sp. NC0429]
MNECVWRSRRANVQLGPLFGASHRKQIDGACIHTCVKRFISPFSELPMMAEEEVMRVLRMLSHRKLVNNNMVKTMSLANAVPKTRNDPVCFDEGFTTTMRFPLPKLRRGILWLSNDIRRMTVCIAGSLIFPSASSSTGRDLESNFKMQLLIRLMTFQHRSKRAIGRCTLSLVSDKGTSPIFVRSAPWKECMFNSIGFSHSVNFEGLSNNQSYC